MIKKKLILHRLLLTGIITVLLFTANPAHAQETKWIAVGHLHDWFMDVGCEIELGRTGVTTDQGDGLRWPAEYRYQDTKAAKALWIGATNYIDPLINNQEVAYKVVHVGPRVYDAVLAIMPQEFTLKGRFQKPRVSVDGLAAGKLDFMEEISDENIDPDLPSDRMIFNVVNTSLGITMKRKVYAWSQQDHDNYFIYDYVFTNTGIYDSDGNRHNQTLTGVIFYWQYRYAPTREPGPYGDGNYWVPQSSSWGHSTMNDAIFTHPVTGALFRSLFSWYGKHSKWTGPAGSSSIGAPDVSAGGDGHFGAAQCVGTLVLHADTSPSDPTDDPNQPITTEVLESDEAITYANSQFNVLQMVAEYEQMMKGRPQMTHAQIIETDNLFADQYSTLAGGFSQTHGFGPYTIAPGDSIHIVIAEGVAGLSRDQCYALGEQWHNDDAPFDLPQGGTTDDREVFKNEWVFTGKDSLFQTLSRAQENYEGGFNITDPPPPPEEFIVESGGDRISLTWANNAESWPGFAGYRIYRSMVTPDTTFELIYECGEGTPNPLINQYNDTSPVRGFDYYYYIASFDDGSSSANKVLESSRFYTTTIEPAFLRRPAGNKLSDIRVVPNPYNIRARDLQYGAGAPDRIMFLNIPPYCTIRIFTERGDLINTIEHTDGSGDEPWNLITSSRQTVVSGVYIADIEVAEDVIDPGDGSQVFKKGEHHIVKFAVIR
jgi:hypothetical protein